MKQTAEEGQRYFKFKSWNYLKETRHVRWKRQTLKKINSGSRKRQEKCLQLLIAITQNWAREKYESSILWRNRNFGKNEVVCRFKAVLKEKMWNRRGEEERERYRERQRDMAINLNIKHFVVLSFNNCWQNQNQSVENLMIMYDSQTLYKRWRTRGIINS